MTGSLTTRKRLLLAFSMLKRDAGPSAKGPSISAVAKAAGVSHALIHTKYPDIAAQIRDANGTGALQRVERDRSLLEVTEARVERLREELQETKNLNRGLASENATLLLKIKRLEDKVLALEAGVYSLSPKKR